MTAPDTSPGQSAGPAPLEVLVNLTWLVPGVVGGSEESTTDALRAVLEHRPEIRLHLAVLAPFLAAHRDLADACPCEVLELDGSNRVARVLRDQTWLAGRTRALAPDLVHHAGGVVPLRHPGRCTLTIHDVQPLDLPANFSPAKRVYLRAMLGRSTRAAEVVCVPSEFTRDRVVERLGVDPARVVVVPWAVPEPAGDPEHDADDRVAWSGEPAGPVILYPAVTHPHKNHAVLLDAFAALARDHDDAVLVLTGGQGGAEAEVAVRMAAADLRGRVLRPGRVSTAEMEALYRRATAVVVPSRYEGFGLPALEAMARGVPVVVSAAGSLPEVVGSDGSAASPVDPDDVAGWRTAMESVITLDPGRRTAVVEAGRRRAAAFGPRRTAEALAGAWHRASADDPTESP